MNRHERRLIKRNLDRLLALVPADSRPAVADVFCIAFACHEGQYRESGEPYILHPVRTALLLAGELRASGDTNLLMSALLHDALEDSPLQRVDLAQYDPVVTVLVHGVSKIHAQDAPSRAGRQVAAFENLFETSALDLRVIVLKLADRLSNILDLQGLKRVRRRRRVARETMDYYVPLARLLGMDRVRRLLEDRCFACLEPEAYARVKKLLSRGRPKCLQRRAQAIRESLTRAGISARVGVWPRGPAGIWRRLPQHQDRMAGVGRTHYVKILTSDDGACYDSLDLLRGAELTPELRLRDYIATPKPNGYEGLHATLGVGAERYDVRIQTPGMHTSGEEASRQVRRGRRYTRYPNGWLDDADLWCDMAEPPELKLKILKRCLGRGEMVVRTPGGQPVVLPDRRPTVLDFAFRICPELGRRCTGGRVNGRPARPLSRLKWGDSVRVEAGPIQPPTPSWLSRTRTVKAYRHIWEAMTDANDIIH